MHYLVPGPLPCPEVVAVFYIRPAEVPTLFSVEGDAQVELQNTVVGFITIEVGRKRKRGGEGMKNENSEIHPLLMVERCIVNGNVGSSHLRA